MKTVLRIALAYIERDRRRRFNSDQELLPCFIPFGSQKVWFILVAAVIVTFTDKMMLELASLCLVQSISV